MQHRVYNVIIAIIANTAATIVNAHIATILISSRMLIIKCDNIYNTAPTNVRSRDTVNIYNFITTPATATTIIINVIMLIILLVLI